jgi:hypothetical protein
MREWEPIVTAPFDENLEVGVAGKLGVDALVLLCRRTDRGWTLTATGDVVLIQPTHWRRPAPFVLGFNRRADITAPLNEQGSATTDKVQ